VAGQGADQTPAAVGGETTDLIRPFAAIDRTALSIVGGKGANLGELTRAGFPVPPGFCVTTAAYALVAAGAGLEPILDALAATRPEQTERLAELAAAARERLLAAPLPAAVADAVTGAYLALGDGRPVPVAARSSATAEDLPDASFAGQQDTYLNVVGVDAVLDAVRRCWASLWTDRAVAYRARNGIDHRTVQLAVVAQRMIEATVAGILFTADPVTGRRGRAVIDAGPGLGEAIVSGAVNPDHFVVDTAAGAIVERRLGDKRVAVEPLPGGGTRRVERAAGDGAACLADAQIRALAELGARVEAHYGAPQDTEWAIDAAGAIWLLQARPITTLYPLPAGRPRRDDDLRVYFSFNVAQGVFRPLTPMGLQAFHLIGSAVATRAGWPPRDRLVGPSGLVDAGHRLFIDITGLVRSGPGRRLLPGVMRMVEARTGAVLGRLMADPRLTPTRGSPWPLARTLARLLLRERLLIRLVQAVVAPGAARGRAARLVAEAARPAALPPAATAADRLDLAEARLEQAPHLLFGIAPVFVAGLAANALAGRLLGDLASLDERQAVLRGLPHNPTTEMDLALWALAQRIRADPASARRLAERAPERLADDYRAGALPEPLQAGLADFLSRYGQRGVAEIDLGLPRWSEDPTHILGVLANYLQLTDPELAPDLQFRRAADAARAMAAELRRRAGRRGWLRGTLVGFLLGRARGLSGLREAPKFVIVTVLARVRELLRPVGDELARAGRLTAADDIFFITLPEARVALAGADLRPVVAARRAEYARELGRRRVPRILLSDGSEPEAEAPAEAGALRGTPASAGVATAPARVILDPTGARLAPGEILVAPSTDPGWTPLFLTAGGLVMEMGGAMSHGAVVAREYGIPAVVGVPDATERIATGQRVTVDGSAGTVAVEVAPEAEPDQFAR
jgi:pyruvate,water dikinase